MLLCLISCVPSQGKGPITLVYSARDDVHNDPIVLGDLLVGRKVATAATMEDQERK